MSIKRIKKGEVLTAMLLLLLSSLIVIGSGSALEPQTGSISFVVIYKDANTHVTDFLSGIEASLYDVDGNLVDKAVSTPLVKFKEVEYGVYTVRIDPVKMGDYVFDAGYAIVKLSSGGLQYLSGGSFTNITVVRYPLNSEILLNVTEQGNPVEAKAYVYSHNCLVESMDILGDHLASNSSIKAKVNVALPAVVKIVREEGGVKETYLTVVRSDGEVNVDLSQYTKIWGIIWDSSTNTIVSEKTRITLADKSTEEPLITWSSDDGTFSIYLKSDEYSSYYLTITADGYTIAKETPKTTLMNVYLEPVSAENLYTFKISDDVKSITLTYKFEVLESTILQGLPYSEYGVLSYQMKLLGMSSTELIGFMENRVREYTTSVITLDGNIYELESKSASWKPIEKNGENGYEFTITATYHNEDINKDKLLKDGKINLLLYASVDKTVGCKRVYGYEIQLPEYLERSNKVEGADASGYVGSVEISNVESSPITIILKERKSPEIYLDPVHFKFGWENKRLGEYIVNQSSENYTIVVPSNVDVWFNVSKVVYDVVRDTVDAKNTTYQWIVDGSEVASGEGVYNITYSFTQGKHTLKLKVTDVGQNTNETSLTILADGSWPTANIVIKAPSGKVLGMFNETSDLKSVKYKLGDESGEVSISGNNATIPTTLIINESEEIVYDATNSYDTYDGIHKVQLPIDVEWSFNGKNSTAINKTYAFDVPSRNGSYVIKVTLRDAVNNTLSISFHVKVKDVTKPVVKMKILSDGKEVTEVKESANVTFDASESYDPDNGTIASYSWTIKDSKYKVINATSYDLINGSFSSDKLEIRFKEYGTYYIILNVTDEDGNYAVLNKTLHVTPVRPDLGITSVDIKGDKVEGSKLTFEVNVTNNGNKVASVYYIAIIVNGKEVTNESFSNLANSSYAIQTVTWTPDSPGKYKVTLKVYCPGEPSSYLSDNEKKEDVTINQAPWKTPAIVIGVIIVIAVIGYLGWIAQKKKKEGKRFVKKTKKEKEKKKK